MALTEADTCRRYITPALVAAGWDTHEQIAEQRYFTDGRIVVLGRTTKRNPGKKADYILRYTRDLPIAVVEAKAFDVPATDGVQQALDYARILGVPFAYATNGQEIIEHDFLTGAETHMTSFPAPADLWARWKLGRKIDAPVEKAVLTPYFLDVQRSPRYYQTIAIDRATAALAGGRERVLLTLATGTGKSFIAFQVCYRLWQARWNRKGSPHKPKILYLADRNVLVDQPMLGVFAPFGDALHRIEGDALKSREMYFATYQAIAKDERRPGLYREYSPDFFDLIVVDECHRGSARDDSNWREILDYFAGAAKLGMTATPLREDNRDTYEYFGNPVYQYSLAQGIEDGFLAPYKVRRVVTDVDAAGWRPDKGQRDHLGREVPDEEYRTRDFERRIVLPERTKAIARYITDYLVETEPFAKTIVFCVDQDHAARMREALIAANRPRVRQYPDYVVRITADEGMIGRGHLDRFQDVDTATPVIATTSEMLSTGVDAPTVRNIVLCRVVSSMTSFKQIVGRGTRLRTDYEKYYFTILDFTGTATRNFADPDFDGFPVVDEEDTLPGPDEPADAGETAYTTGEDGTPEDPDGPRQPEGPTGQPPGPGPGPGPEPPPPPLKYVVDGVQVEVIADLVYELDADGRKLRTVKYTEYAGERVRSMFRSAPELRARWIDPKYRVEVLAELEARGIDVAELAARSKHPDADPFDLLCHVAFSAPLRTRRERAEALQKKNPDFWSKHTPEAREILSAILAKYAEHGIGEMEIPRVLGVPPLSEMGNVIEIAQRFGGPALMAAAVNEMQHRLYDAGVAAVG